MPPTVAGLYQVADRAGWHKLPPLQRERPRHRGLHQRTGFPYLARYDDAPDRIRERSKGIWMGVDWWQWVMAAELRRRDPTLWSNLLTKYPGLAREI